MTATTNGRQLKTTEQADPADKIVAWVPLGETEAIEMSLNRVLKFVARPTRSGALPSSQDVMQFIMLCKARQLNPYVGDAYLIGYDGSSGAEFSLITAIQALHKRAELNAAYDGIQSGLIVERDGEVMETDGAFRRDGDVLLGAWAKCHRKDRAYPAYSSVRLSARDKGRSLWKSDPEGMIRKCAVAAVLRESFPSQCGGLYLHEEIQGPTILDATPTNKQVTRSALNDDPPLSPPPAEEYAATFTMPADGPLFSERKE